MTLSKNKIYQGDCIKQLANVEAGSVDLVFADPPFNIGYEYDVYDDVKSTDSYLGWCREWISGVYRALKEDGTFWLAIGDEYAAELKIESQNAGFHCRSWVIWYYTFGVNCANGFSRSHTHLFHFVKNPKKFTFVRPNPNIRVKSARQLVYADARANPNGRLPDNTWITRPQDAPQSFRSSHDTWFFSRVAGTFKEREGFHGCQMPEQLLGRIIRCSSLPNDLVLDPFGGSGTTLCVAKKLHRNFIGFELSEDYVQHIQKRLEETKIGQPLDGPEDPIESAPQTSQGKQRKTKGLDKKTTQTVVDIFRDECEAYSVEDLLCDKDLNKQFTKSCTKKLRGSAVVWNRLLIQLKKEGQLPEPTQKLPSLSDDRLCELGFASEVACRLIQLEFQTGEPCPSLHEILSCPDTALFFDRLAKDYSLDGTNGQSIEFRQSAFALFRHAAKVDMEWPPVEEWDSLPPDQLDNLLVPTQRAGIFVLFHHDQPVFVGEAANIRERLEALFENPNWQKVDTTQVRILPVDAPFSQRREIVNQVAKAIRSMMNWQIDNA